MSYPADKISGCGSPALFWLTYDQVLRGKSSINWVKEEYNKIGTVLSQNSIMGQLKNYAKTAGTPAEELPDDLLVLAAEKPR